MTTEKTHGYFQRFSPASVLPKSPKIDPQGILLPDPSNPSLYVAFVRNMMQQDALAAFSAATTQEAASTFQSTALTVETSAAPPAGSFTAKSTVHGY